MAEPVGRAQSDAPPLAQGSLPRNNITRSTQLALCLHVDDGVIFTSGLPDQNTAADHGRALMDKGADSLEEVGFVVTDRKVGLQLEKTVDYTWEAHPARLRTPPLKTHHLRTALRHQARGDWVHTGELRALLGVWIWAALVRRGTLSIPHAVFRSMEKFELRPSRLQFVRRNSRCVKVCFCTDKFVAC